MSIAIRANQSGVDQAAAQKAAEKKGHQDVVKSVNAGGSLRKMTHRARSRRAETMRKNRH